MATRQRARSTTSGSRAEFSSTVFTLREASGHHQVLGTGDRNGIHEDAGALQSLRLRVDVARLDGDLGAHGGEPLDVKVHGTLTDCATAPASGHTCLAETRSEGT